MHLAWFCSASLLGLLNTTSELGFEHIMVKIIVMVSAVIVNDQSWERVYYWVLVVRLSVVWCFLIVDSWDVVAKATKVSEICYGIFILSCRRYPRVWTL